MAEHRAGNPTPKRRHFYCNAKGFTPTAENYIRSFSETPLKPLDLSRIVEVIATKEGIPCNVKFTLADGKVLEVDDGFNIGYGGTGPTALYRILLDAGFSVDDAYKVFEKDITSVHITK